MTPLGLQIHGYRLQHKKTRVQVARETGLDYYHYCAIERGHVTPNLTTINRIADVLSFQIVLKPKAQGNESEP